MNITITDAAKEAIAEQNTEGKKVRVYVQGIGWGGPRFALSLDEAKETDVAKEIDGIAFVVDEDTDKQFGTVIVDFSSSFLGKRFMVNYAGGGSFRGGCS